MDPINERNNGQRTVEEYNRIEALANAVRHRLKEETPEQVVAAAQKYFEFLQASAGSCKAPEKGGDPNEFARSRKAI